mmetsp:Transcript_22664/g.34060  ORF Transcript_22664/g.34060 Transcript_22664/m.34060 type:complete len:121 (+) Transcript_22664:336-698(+)
MSHHANAPLFAESHLNQQSGSSIQKNAVLSANAEERELATYYEDFPVFVESAITIQCRPPQNDDTCVIIRSVITLFADRDENPDDIEQIILNGIDESFNSGSFFDALPSMPFLHISVGGN